MLSHVAHSIIALSLALGAHATIPGWSSAAIAAPAKHKCTGKAHRHVKTGAAKPAPAARGAGLSQQRRTSDVQVISFGP
jgi:hypothetical protein